MIPPGILLLVGIYLSAVVDISHPEHTSTLQLRMLLLSFGLTFLYLGAVFWYFDAGSMGLRPEHRWLTRAVCLFVGTGLTLCAAFRSRESLLRDCEYFVKPAYDIEIGGRPDITPAQRVDKTPDARD